MEEPQWDDGQTQEKAMIPLLVLINGHPWFKWLAVLWLGIMRCYTHIIVVYDYFEDRYRTKAVWSSHLSHSTRRFLEVQGMVWILEAILSPRLWGRNNNSYLCEGNRGNEIVLNHPVNTTSCCPICSSRKLLINRFRRIAFNTSPRVPKHTSQECMMQMCSCVYHTVPLF